METSMSEHAGAKFEKLSIDKITLDLENPRIAKWLEMYKDDPPVEQIALALRTGSSQDASGGPSYHSLKQSIQTNGGLIHPIIVNKDEDGKYVVIEGNTRTYIYRELKENDPSGPWSYIPAMIHDSLPKTEVDAIRLQAHLVGTREWDPYSKAKYLYVLRNEKHLTFAQIVDFCGGGKRVVQNLIDAYIDMEKYYRPILDSSQDFDPTRFSAFVELQRSNVTEALLSSNFNKADFSKWVHSKKLYPLNTVRKLPVILSEKSIKDVFLRSGAQQALKELDRLSGPTPDSELKDATLDQLAKEISKRISVIQYDDLKKLRSQKDSPEAMDICDAKDALVELCEDIRFNSE